MKRQEQREYHVYVPGRGHWVELDRATFAAYAHRFPDHPRRVETFRDKSNGQHVVIVDDSRLPAPVVRVLGRNNLTHASPGKS